MILSRISCPRMHEKVFLLSGGTSCSNILNKGRELREGAYTSNGGKFFVEGRFAADIVPR